MARRLDQCRSGRGPARRAGRHPPQRRRYPDPVDHGTPDQPGFDTCDVDSHDHGDDHAELDRATRSRGAGGHIRRQRRPIGSEQVVRFNTDGSTLALAGEGYGLRLYDPDTLALDRELECPTTIVETPDITSFAWNPQVAATWDTDSQTLLTDLMWDPGRLECQVVFSPDVSRAARGEEYKTYDKISDVRTMLWNTTDGTLIGALDGWSPRFSLDGTRIITQVMDTDQAVVTAKIWDATSGQLLSEFDLGGGLFMPPKLSSDRSRVLVGGQLRGRVLDARTFDPIADVSFPEQASAGPGAINHDGTLIASTNGTTVSVWDVATGALVQSLVMESPAVGEIDFSPNGTQLVLAEFLAASVWDLTTGDEVFRIDASAPPAFSPDGALLAIATLGNQPKLFDTATGEQLNESDSSISPFGFIAFSPDGSTLAVNGASSVELWTYTRT